MNSSRKSRCKRNQNGGGLGGNVEFAPGSSIVNNDLAWKSGSSCVAEQRFGFLTNGYTGPKGLPGMSGGARRRKTHSRKIHSRKIHKRKTQRGGRYSIGEFDGVGMGAPWGSGLAPTVSIPCEASRAIIPDSGASNTLNMRGSSLWDGPVMPKGMLGGGAPTSASPSEIVPTARYSDLAEPGITSSTGSKIMIHTPLNFTEMNPACLKTGGGSRRRRHAKKHSRKTKKSRKINKHRKH